MLTGFLRAFLRPFRSRIALIALLQLVQTACILLLPTINALIIDNGVVKGDRSYIITLGIVMGAIVLTQVTVAIWAERAGAAVSAAFGRDLRAATFHRVLSLSTSEIDKFGAPSLITRTINDVKQTQTLTLTLFDAALATAILSIGGVLLSLLQDTWLGLLIVGMFLAVSVCIGVVIATMWPLYDKLQRGIDLVSRILREQIVGVRVVRAFVQQRRESGRFSAANNFIFDPSLRVGRLISSFASMVLLVTNVFMVALVWFGGVRVDEGSLQLGELSALMGYITLIVLAMVMMLVVVTSLSRAFASARRICAVLLTASTVAEPEDPEPAVGVRGTLEVRGASFGFAGSEALILDRVDLRARPGETVALVGGTGSGKSILLNLAMRQFDVTGGSILVEGTDVRKLSADALTDAIGIVPQTARLFSGTVRENLRFGAPDADDHDLWAALRIAQADSFVSDMPDGLDTLINQAGRNLSGGQRQRLAIARTLVRRPRVLLLDDALSALDAGTERRLREALQRELADTTILLTSQRIGAVREADHIVVLDAGRVVGSGTHDELLVRSRVYREIVESQPLGKDVIDAGH